MPSDKFTRGFGLLENFLSMQRMKKAQSIIKKQRKKGRILDIGCGSYPFFLINSNFSEKYGINQEIIDNELKDLNLRLFNQNICIEPDLPFIEEFFDVITMLAVVEHLSYNEAYNILKECYSLLQYYGILIITTLAYWSDTLLKIMAKFHIVSPEEIGEHKSTFNLQEIFNFLHREKFKKNNIEKGYFEFF